jgi:regulator of sigma E protease
LGFFFWYDYQHMSILLFLLILSFLVIIHELGHFLVAKRLGVKVEEFGMGYPPRALRLFTDKAGTEYTINWLPFGGFVRLFGEDGEVPDVKQQAFVHKKPSRKLMIVLAGAIVNFVFGALAFGAIYTKVGIPTELGYVRIDVVAPNSPAEEAGLAVGDQVVAVEINNVRTPVTGTEKFIDALRDVRGTTIILELVDGQSLPIYVRTTEETPENQGATGVVVADTELKHYPMWQMPFRGMYVGVQSALTFGKLLASSLGVMVRDLVTLGKVPQDVAGPFGIAYAVQKDNILETGWLAVVNFAAILSINLAIVNVLPLPALDGGRAVFILFELLTGKRVKPRVEQLVNTVGFMMLLGLIILISLRDLRRVFEDQAIRDWFGGLF